MLWPINRKKKNRSSQAHRKQRRLRVESLEARRLLTVDIQFAGGNLNLIGDNASDHIELRETSPNDFVITGLDGTLLQLNGVDVTSPQTVFDVAGNINVDLGLGNNEFEFLGHTVGGGANSTAPFSVIINNAGGTNTNTLQDVTVLNDLIVGGTGVANLNILDSTIIEQTIVTNALGESETTIDNSHLQGFGGFALILVNGNVKDIVQIQGQSTFGDGANLPPLPLPTVVLINNGDGGSRTSFAGDSVVYGGVDIFNGSNGPQTMDIVTFNSANVLGRTFVSNMDGDTETMVIDSGLGTHLTGGEAAYFHSDFGYDDFFMQNSSVPWGLQINTDLAAAGASVSPSTTHIMDSSIGTRPGGPVPGLGLANDALVILLGNGNDTVNIGPGNTIGGNLNIGFANSNNGINDISMLASSADSFFYTGGNGNDTVSISSSTIPAELDVQLFGGADLLEVLDGTVLPDPLLAGPRFADGGMGVDTLFEDPDVVNSLLAGTVINFEQ